MSSRRMVTAGSKSKIQLSGTSRHQNKKAMTEMRKEIFPLPEPKNKGIIKKIIGPNGKQLRHMEKAAKIKPYDIRQKKNEVHIVGTKEQVEKVKKILTEIIKKELKRQEESKDDKVVLLPPDKIGLIMGKDGSVIKNIERECSCEIHVKEKAAHIKGSPINMRRAEIKIQELLEKNTQSTEGKIKVGLPPNCELGRIVGRNFSNIEKFKMETGACIEDIGDAIYVSGEASKCKKAIIKIKSKADDVCNKKRSQAKFNFLDATKSAYRYFYKLEEFDCPNPSWDGEKHFKVYRMDEEQAEDDDPEDLNTEELQTFLHEVLKEVQQENKDKEVKAELFCHFGHLYIGNIDEVDQINAYKLSALKAEFEKNKKDSWKLRFNPAIEELEFKGLEKTLQDDNGPCTVDPHIRHDFQFYTPYCTSIRAKTFMNMDGNIDSTFSHEDIDIRKNDPQQESEASPAPQYMLCDQLQTRARVNIMILSEGMDCRLAIRTVSPNEDHQGTTEEFEKNVSKYLDKISFADKELCMPSEQMPGNPGDYCLHYWRKCHRRSYPYNVDGEGFSITISEEDVMDVTGSGEIESTKTDIHLRCDEWDKLLRTGKWEPEQIVEKLPQFLKFVREVQSNIPKKQE